MKYFYDCEFLEGTQTKTFLGITIGKTPPTIDLISIGIVAEDGREYYAISKEFNLKEAWNRCEIKDRGIDGIRKTYWIRDNVLMPIYKEWIEEYNAPIIRMGLRVPLFDKTFTFSNFKKMLFIKGKSNTEIANEFIKFVNDEPIKTIGTHAVQLHPQSVSDLRRGYLTPMFYGYYSAYDHVAICWLFGKMMDLPKGFPMYTIDLKQSLDKKAWEWVGDKQKPVHTFDNALQWIKDRKTYPKQTNEHSAIHDARWNKKLYEFLQKI